jgi:site-specific DNA-cytosine methylase
VSKDSLVYVDVDNSNYSVRCKKQIKKNGKYPYQKSVAVCTNSNLTGSGVNAITNDGVNYRKLTPIEAERLQTVPDNYTNHVSSSQRYKMIGNGWTVDVISHIFSFMDVKNDR